MNRPREGNIPGLLRASEKDAPAERHPLTRKVDSGLAEPIRDTSRNRFLAEQNGWTEKEYLHWVDTGQPPMRSVVSETPATRPDEIDDDERLHR